MKWLGRFIVLLVLVGVIGVAPVAWKQRQAARSVPDDAPNPSGVAQSSPDPRLTKLPDGLVAMRDAIAIASSLHQKDQSAEFDVQAIEQVLELYRFVYKANPVGSENEEIMAALMGKNPKGLVFVSRDHPSLTERGALKDRWGMPYYFHPLSAQLMDVRSAGPDGKLWTQDDQSLGLDEQAKDLKLTR